MSKENEVQVHDTSLFANAYSYLGIPFSRNVDAKNIDAFIMGVPYDLATTGRSGARMGPGAIRKASSNLRWEEKRWPWSFALSKRLSVADYGDLELICGDSDNMLEQVEAHAKKIISAGKILVTLGGDHFVTLPLLRAHAAKHGKLALIHFDAHTDTYEEAEQKYNHGCMFFRAPQENLIDPSKSIQIGIRTEYDLEKHEYQVIDAHQANEQSVSDTINAIRNRVKDMPIYLSFDIDALDPAFAPGTGTPVVGGLSSSRAMRILQGIADLNIVGFDLMEVSPAYDHAEITALAGATLAQQFLYMRASQGA